MKHRALENYTYNKERDRETERERQTDRQTERKGGDRELKVYTWMPWMEIYKL